LVAKPTKDTRSPLFPSFMLPRNLSRSTYHKTGGGDSRVTAYCLPCVKIARSST
jgi:hypothetical protein